MAIFVINENNLNYRNRVKLDCETSSKNEHSYTIEWRRNDSEMSPRSSVIENSLIIDDFCDQDLGEYCCVVSNGGGQVKKSIRFYDAHNQLKYTLGTNCTNAHAEIPKRTSSTSPTTTASPTTKLATTENEQRFKFLFDILNLRVGDPLAIECVDLCKLIRIFFLVFNLMSIF